MHKLITLILFVFALTSAYTQVREVKPEAEEFSPGNQNFFPQHRILFPDSSQLPQVIDFFESKIANASGKGGAYPQAMILFCIAELNRMNGNNLKAMYALGEVLQALGEELDAYNRAKLESRIFFNYVAALCNARDTSNMSRIVADAGYQTYTDMGESVMQVFEDVGDAENLQAMIQMAFSCHVNAGSYQQAYRYGNRLVRFKDSISELRLKEQFATLEDANEMTQKQREIRLLNNQKKLYNERILASTRGLWALIGGVGLLVVFAFALLHRVRTIRRTRDLLQIKAAQYQHEKTRAEKNEIFKEQFLANVSHEIRTPMNAISGITNILIRNKHPESQDKYLLAMRDSARNLLVLINDILDLSKLGAGKLELVEAPFSPAGITQEVYDNLHSTARKKGLEFLLEVDDQIPVMVQGDGKVLSNILMNLVNNAISFTSAGQVGLKCFVLTQDDDKVVLQFEVMDTGMGIVPEKQDKILKTFVKVYDSDSIQYQGSGLELAIINQLVELQEGKIRLESEPEEGTTFILEIPYSLQTIPEASEPADTIVEDRVLKDVAILLVEDNEFNVMVASTELESAIEGLTLEVAENGQLALDKLAEKHFDLILMDVQMPVMDGYEATRRIRKLRGEKSRLPIIAMTANVLKQEIDRCIKEGMDDYISKPFDTDQLVSKIKNLYFRKN